MRRIATAASGAVAVAAILALGIAVAGLAASGSLSGIAQTTSEETTETTEKPKTTKFRAVATAGAEVPKPLRSQRSRRPSGSPGATSTFRASSTRSSARSWWCVASP